jgi:hypothetical protein
MAGRAGASILQRNGLAACHPCCGPLHGRPAEQLRRRPRACEPATGVFERGAEMQLRHSIGGGEDSVEFRVASPGRHGYWGRVARLARLCLAPCCPTGRVAVLPHFRIQTQASVWADCLAGRVNTNLPRETNLGETWDGNREGGAGSIAGQAPIGLPCRRLASTTGLAGASKTCGGCPRAASEMTGAVWLTAAAVMLEGPSECCSPRRDHGYPPVYCCHADAVPLRCWPWCWPSAARRSPVETPRPPIPGMLPPNAQQPTCSGPRHGRHPRAGVLFMVFRMDEYSVRTPYQPSTAEGTVAVAQAALSCRPPPHRASALSCPAAGAGTECCLSLSQSLFLAAGLGPMWCKLLCGHRCSGWAAIEKLRG